MLEVYNIIPAEISALDPARNTSRLKVLDSSLEGTYLPGHLIGDRGSVCIREHEVKVRTTTHPSQPNQVQLRVQEATPVASGVRIRFADHVCAIVSESDWQELRGEDRLWVEIPRTAIHFIG